MKYGDNVHFKEILGAVSDYLIKTLPHLEDHVQDAFVKLLELDVPQELAKIWNEADMGRQIETLCASHTLAALVEKGLQQGHRSESDQAKEEHVLFFRTVCRLRGIILFYAKKNEKFSRRTDGKRRNREHTYHLNISEPSHNNAAAFAGMPDTLWAWMDARAQCTFVKNRNQRARLKKECRRLWNADVAVYVRQWLSDHHVKPQDLGWMTDYLSDQTSKTEVARKYGLAPTALSNRATRLRNLILAQIRNNQ